tara:strand:- start:1515 stop:1775 length:261 start_codon:yes stop_codon:yes gene_type:complete
VEYLKHQNNQRKMGFNKRYLTESSIRSVANSDKENFKGFQRYMIGADAYIIEQNENNWASNIFNKFDNADEEEQKQIFVNITLNKI